MMAIQHIAGKVRVFGIRYCRDGCGAAAAEFALVLSLLAIPILNVVDFGIYVFQKMELDNAAQVAVQAAWATCITPANLPATPNSYANCLGLPAAMTTAVQSTPLGAGATVTATNEGYYCVNTTTSALVAVGTFPNNKPSDCSSVGSSADRPGDYISVTVSYTYMPFFPGVTVTSLLTTPITRTAWSRLG